MKSVILTFFFLVQIAAASAQSKILLRDDFSHPGTYQLVGRGICKALNGALITKDAYASFGEADWTDYEISFRGRVPDTAKQVQLCSGFRAGSREDRYFVLLKGGNEQFLCLARLGYMGSDDFIALRKLDFHPSPGQWYDFKIQVAGSRIRIFLNGEILPRIDIRDSLSRFAPKGKVTLGGSWITNEFKDLVISRVDTGSINHIPLQEVQTVIVNKAALRLAQRAAYRPVSLGKLTNGRQSLSLNGNWLFSPGEELSGDAAGYSPGRTDSAWHILHVPDFWNPIHVWQHGEKYNSASKGVADNYYEKETERCEALTFDYKKTAIGWYRQWLYLPAGVQNKNAELTFDAIAKISEVWINGKKAGGHTGMFGELRLDVSKLLKPGKNLIAVKVSRDYIKNMENAGKIAGVAVTVEVTEKMVKDLAHGFFNDDPAGIWQPVTLTLTDKVHIGDVFIKPDLTGAAMDVTLINDKPFAQQVSLLTDIDEAKTSQPLYHTATGIRVTLQPGESRKVSYTLEALKPHLWSPDHPDLYDFKFSIAREGELVLDSKVIRSGFRTFKSAGDYLYLNGKRYWLRGANQSTMPLAPNDTAMAEKFSRLMKDGHMDVTRTHTVPYDETWMNASDEYGIGVSYEGTWPWLFLGSSMPSSELIGLWEKEFYELMVKYRNHPSLLFWTMNNEMKFYDADPNSDRAKLKMKIISDVVKKMRLLDPSRPIVFDSNYRRDTRRFGKAFYQTIDDGDIDDPHAYYNWYDYSLFNFFKGEWQKNNKNDGRPLICQEMSTGYTDETGHPTRYYTYVHQNPSELVGKFAFEYNDPAYFLKTQAFISKELAEALRRSNDKSAGILHFSSLTWFKNVDDVKSMVPWPVYHEMARALQPILVSAELWGRHFYTGTKLPVQICIVNDLESGKSLSPTVLEWKLTGKAGETIAKGEVKVPQVDHYSRYWFRPEINIPEISTEERTDGRLVLNLLDRGVLISENSYDLLFMGKATVSANLLRDKKILVFDPGKHITPALDFVQIPYILKSTVAGLTTQQADLFIVAGTDSITLSEAGLDSLKKFVTGNRHVLFANCGRLAQLLFPGDIRSVIREKAEVANMEMEESAVFAGLDILDIRNFNDNTRTLPAAIAGAYRINRSDHLTALSSYTKVHGYLPGNVAARMQKLDQIRGYPLIEIAGQGRTILSEFMLEKTVTDPVAGKLLINMVSDLLKNK